jgi:hypothetical protein
METVVARVLAAAVSLGGRMASAHHRIRSLVAPAWMMPVTADMAGRI